MKHSVAFCVFVVAVAIPRVSAVTIEVVPGTSIQKSIDSATAGDEIVVPPGTYRESLMLKPGVSLVGTDRDAVIVESPSVDDPAIKIHGCKAGKVQSIAFKQSGAQTAAQSNLVCVVEISDSNIELTDCIVSDGTDIGIRLTGSGEPRVLDSLIQNNHGDGIVIETKSVVPRIYGDTITGNGGSGITFSVADTRAAVSRCTITNNKGFGIFDDVGASVNYGKNELAPNDLIGKVECVQFFNAQQFDKLEDIFTKIRREKSRYPSGRWQLPHIYGFLAGDADEINADELVRRERLLTAWKAAFPDSLTWRLVLTNMYTGQAWKARGNGFANTVTPEGWRGYSAWMEKARAVMDEAAKIEPKDPAYYVDLCALNLEVPREKATGVLLEMIEAATAQKAGALKDEAAVSFEQGIKFEPEYLPLYTERTRELLPRWRGSVVEIMQFAKQSASHIGGDRGDAIYAIIALTVWEYEREDAFLKDYSFSWEQVKKGFDELIRQNPKTNYYRNAYVRMAVSHRDAGVAARIFPEIKKPQLNFWANEIEFNAFKKWALEKTPYPEESPLEIAATSGDETRVRALLAAGADPKSSTRFGESILSACALLGRVDVVKALLEKGADPNSLSADGYPILRAALDDKDEALLSVLLSHGADVNAPDKEGWTPLALAIAWQKPNLVPFLLDHGADPNGKSTSTPLQTAVRMGDGKTVALLIEKGADLNAVPPNNTPPLSEAARRGDAPLCKYLIEHGADPNASSSDGETAIFVAAGLGHLDVARVLAERGADIHKRELDGWSAFHMAAKAGQVDVLKYLLEKAPDGLSAVTKTGDTLLHTAAKDGRAETARFLIGKGLDVNARNQANATPLAVALQGKKEKTAKAIRDAGGMP